ncbi:hypothetical protein EDD30_0890 [Couchioplanes caeruleus]|uniref:Uncharacterized protein n=1 Tax=Couchioplanes caeruleus TaxID=56438 RepID=A0A3N1GD22_9ACTN|nr:hypothetical protein EDD30_0890 [Couchioplanes caeruleus]
MVLVAAPAHDILVVHPETAIADLIARHYAQREAVDDG